MVTRLPFGDAANRSGCPSPQGTRLSTVVSETISPDRKAASIDLRTRDARRLKVGYVTIAEVADFGGARDRL
jgi:hypothetical protein